MSLTPDKPPSGLMLEPEPGAEALPSPENTSHEALLATEASEGTPLTHRTFVPMPPICSDSTVHSEPGSHPSRAAALLSPEHPSDEDAKSTESIFLTQVPFPRGLHPWLQCPQVPALSSWHCLGLPRTGRETRRPCSSQGPLIRATQDLAVQRHSQHLGSPWDVVLASLQRAVTAAFAKSYLTSQAALGPGNQDGVATGSTSGVLMV